MIESKAKKVANKFNAQLVIKLDPSLPDHEERFFFQPTTDGPYCGIVNVIVNQWSDYNVAACCHELSHAKQRDRGSWIVLPTCQEKLAHELEACEMAWDIYQEYFANIHPGIDREIFRQYTTYEEKEHLLNEHLQLVSKHTNIDIGKNFDMLVAHLGRKCTIDEAYEMVATCIDNLVKERFDES